MPTPAQKKSWNEAVKAILKEVKKYDGLIPAKSDRDYLIKRISERLIYKLKKG